MAEEEEHLIVVTEEDRERWNKQRRNTKWKKIINEDVVKDALPWYRQQGIKPTLRTIYYRLVGLKVIPNTKSAYGSLSDNIVLARQEGRIEWDDIIDSVRYTVEDFDYDHYISPNDYIRWALNELEELPGDYLNRVYKWYKQEDIIEIWLEKGALASTLQSFLKGKHVRVAVNRGYSSWTFAYENLRRLQFMAHRNPLSYEKGIVQRYHIKYFGDYDPSGKGMDKHIEEQIKFLIDHEFRSLRGLVYFQRLAVTLDQIEKYNLPQDPDKTAIRRTVNNDVLRPWSIRPFKIST